jgi:hypothetical protein
MKHTTQDGFVWTIVTKEQAIELLHSGKEVYKVYDDESESLIEMNVQMDDDRGVMFYAVEGEQPPRKWAREDSKTGKGINEGYVICDGWDYYYFAEKSDLVEYLRRQISDGGEGLSDDFILNDAYDNDVYCYTEWELEDEMYYYIEQPDGTLEQVWKD